MFYGIHKYTGLENQGLIVSIIATNKFRINDFNTMVASVHNQFPWFKTADELWLKRNQCTTSVLLHQKNFARISPANEMLTSVSNFMIM